MPRGSTSVVVRCEAPGGRRAVLKVAPDVRRLAGEVAALRHWDGEHVPAVLADDASGGAVLLEEIVPGTTLREEGQLPTAGELAALLSGLHRPDPLGDHFPPLTHRIGYLFDSWEQPRRRDPRLAGLVPEELLVRGRRLADRLAEEPCPGVLLHGDLTPVNVLDGGDERGLVAIDPAPCVGDAAFDAIDLTLWRCRSLEEITGRVDALGRAARLGPSRLLSWCTAFAAMAAMDVAELPDASPDAIGALLELAARAPAG